MKTEVQAVCNLLGIVCVCQYGELLALAPVLQSQTQETSCKASPEVRFLDALEVPFIDGRTASCTASVVREFL